MINNCSSENPCSKDRAFLLAQTWYHIQNISQIIHIAVSPQLVQYGTAHTPAQQKQNSLPNSCLPKVGHRPTYRKCLTTQQSQRTCDRQSRQTDIQADTWLYKLTYSLWVGRTEPTEHDQILNIDKRAQIEVHSLTYNMNRTMHANFPGKCRIHRTLEPLGYPTTKWGPRWTPQGNELSIRWAHLLRWGAPTRLLSWFGSLQIQTIYQIKPIVSNQSYILESEKPNQSTWILFKLKYENYINLKIEIQIELNWTNWMNHQSVATDSPTTNSIWI